MSLKRYIVCICFFLEFSIFPTPERRPPYMQNWSITSSAPGPKSSPEPGLKTLTLCKSASIIREKAMAIAIARQYSIAIAIAREYLNQRERTSSYNPESKNPRLG